MHRRRFTRMLVCVVAAVESIVTGTAGQAADLGATWPQWGGPTRDGLVQGAIWPKRLTDEHFTLAWHVDLGPGYPGPIVAADRVFVAETKDQKLEIVRALDRKTGGTLGAAEWPGAMSVPFMAKRNGDWIRSTPAYDGQSVYVAGMRDVLVCLDAGTGAERWRVDFVEQFKSPLPTFGFVCSPLVVGDHVFVQAAAGFWLNGAAFGRNVVDFTQDVATKNNSGHMILAMRGDNFQPAHVFKSEMDRVIREIRESERMEGVDRIWLPGEMEFYKIRERLETGIPVNPALQEQLRQLAKELQLPDRLE